MLELCTELHDCEEVLSASLDGVKYLGEVNFSLEDIDILAGLFKAIINENEEEGISYLKGFPACVSIYLVGMGITNYQGGEFWPSVLVGIGAAVTRSQYALGAIFCKLLRSKSLARVRIKGALAFVTPILLHGGIPRSCYEEFYDKVVKYFVQKGLVEESQVRNGITIIRDFEKQRVDLLDQKESLQCKENALKAEIKKLSRLGELFHKKEELKEKIAGREPLVGYCEYNNLLTAREAERLSLMRKKEDLLNKNAAHLNTIGYFTADDQRLLDYSVHIGKLVNEYKTYQEARDNILDFEQKFIKWGKGDLAAGVQLFTEIKQVLKELIGVEANLNELWPGHAPGSPVEALKLELKLGRVINDLTTYRDLKYQQAVLKEAIGDLDHWAGLPDYQGFMMDMKTRMDEIAGELNLLRAREKRIQVVAQSLSKYERKVLDLAEEVERLSLRQAYYQGCQKKQELLQEEAERHARMLDTLAGELSPGGWKEDYTSIVLKLDINEVERELSRLGRFTLERDQAEDSLTDYKIKKSRPSLALWFTGVLAAAGLGFALTNQSDLSHLALLVGLAALAAGYWWFNKSRRFLAEQEKQLAMLRQELLWAAGALEQSKVRLEQMLHGFPSPGSPAASVAWVSLVRKLKRVCCDHKLCQEELAGLKQDAEGWEAGLKEVAAALWVPLSNTPRRVMAKLTEHVRKTRLRSKEAREAGEVLEKEIMPAVCSAESCLTRLEREVSETEQRFADLGGGILEAGVQLVQRKKEALQNLHDIEAGLERLSIHQNGDYLDEAIRWEKNFAQAFDNLRYYIRLKNQQAELEKTGGIPCTSGDAPDYCELMAAGKAELGTLLSELEILEVRKRKKLALAGSYSEADQRILGLAERFDISELSALKKLVGDWEDSIREIAGCLSMPVTGEPEEIMRELVSQLEQAGERKAKARAAQEALSTQVRPALDETADRLAQVDREIAALKQRIRELGKGDLAEGKRLLEEFRQDLSRLKEIKNEIEVLTNLLPKLPGSCQGARALAEEKNIKLNSTKRNLFHVEEQLEKISLPIDYADEPVQRFVIYGGEWAVKWLWAGIALYRRGLGEAIDLAPATQGLPDRVAEDLAELSRVFIVEEPPEPVKERFSCPEILFDPGQGELKMAVGGHSFQNSDNETRREPFVSIVSGENTPAWSADIALGCYLTGGKVEIPQKHISVPHISRDYLVTLTTGDGSRTWRVQAYGEVPCLIFSEKGKMIEPGQLAEQRAWLLFPSAYNIFNENALVYSGDIYFGGSRYRQVLVNFLLEPVVSLVGEHGVVYEISSSRYGLPRQPFLSYEETAAGVWAKGSRAVYTGAVPQLNVPFDVDTENQWTLRVERMFIGEVAEKKIDVRIAPPAANEDKKKYYEINLESLELLGPNPIGEYTIVLSQGDLPPYQFEMVIFPDVMVLFEKELYFPSREQGSRARLSVVIPEALRDILRVRAIDPARLMGRDDDEYHLSVDLECDHLEMAFLYISAGRPGHTSITVEIPKVSWRITGAETPNLEKWTHYVEEVWHKACYGPGPPQLEVKLPGCLNNSAERFKVILEGTGHQVTAKTRGKLLNFDLVGLADSLMGGKDVYSLWFALEDARGRQLALGKLLDLRRRWRVERFQYEVMEESPDQWLFKATWVDLGEEQDRVVRLWRLWEPWTRPLTFPIPDGFSKLDAPMSTAEVPPGPYLLKFGVDDSWSGEGLLDEFPRESEDSRIVYICGSVSHILVNKCIWEGQRKLRIRGSLTGGSGSRKVLIRLYGINKGESTVYTLEITTDENGNFNLFAEPPRATRPHWLGIITREQNPLYHFQVLPVPGKLDWPLGYEGVFAVQTDANGRIYIDSKEENLDEPYLSEERSYKVLQAWREGIEKYNIKIRIWGQLKKAQLWKRSHTNDAKITLETSAIKCTSCGKIEPNQKAWDQGHYPKCKSFMLNFREMNATLYWEWDIAPALAIAGIYALSENHWLVLYHNLFRPLPDDVLRGLCSQDSRADAEALIDLLWKKELDLLRAGGITGEHQPD